MHHEGWPKWWPCLRGSGDRRTPACRVATGPIDRTSTTSDKDRIRDQPCDLCPLADRATPDRRTRRLLQHHGGTVARLKHIAAAFARKERLGHGDAEAILRRRRTPAAVGETDTLRTRRQRDFLARSWRSERQGADDRAFALGPEFNIFIPKPGLTFLARYEPEFGGRNRTQGQTIVFSVAWVAKSLAKGHP